MAYLDMDSPDLYRQAIRNGVAITHTVNATRGGVPIEGYTGMAPDGGTITDTTKAGVRRVLSLDLAPAPGLFDALAPVGTELVVTAHIRFSDRSVVNIPCGVFDVDSQSMSEGVGGLSLTAPDKWVRIQRATFIRPQASTKGLLVTSQIALLIRGALGVGEPVINLATSTATVGTLLWEQDRDEAIIKLAEGIGAWVYFDRDGVATIADIPTTGDSADWLIDSSAAGVLTELSRERSRTSTSNVVVVSSSASEGTVFATQTVWDTNPDSPTYAGTNPVSAPETAGPFGIVTLHYETPLPLSDLAARRTGETILARESGLVSQVSLGQVPNPAVDAFDVLDVLAPKVWGVAQVMERHIADTVSHPLGLGQAQNIDGRSVGAS